MGTTAKILAAVIAALVVGLGVQTCRLSRAEEAARAGGLREDSLVAVADTSKRLDDLIPEIADLLGDSLDAVQRRSVQAQRPDALDATLRRELGLIRTALAEARLEIRALRVTVAGITTEDSAGTRQATFAVDSTPYRGTVTATLFPPPTPGRLDLDLSLDSAALGVRLLCGARNAAGIRRADVVLTTPPWLTASITRAEQDDQVCNQRERGRDPWFSLRRLGVGVGYGITMALDDSLKLRHGPTGAALYRVWP